jgi:hypothetical protein
MSRNRNYSDDERILARLDSMLEIYAPKLGYSIETRKIIVEREIDPSNPQEFRIARQWIKQGS